MSVNTTSRTSTRVQARVCGERKWQRASERERAREQTHARPSSSTRNSSLVGTVQEQRPSAAVKKSLPETESRELVQLSSAPTAPVVRPPESCARSKRIVKDVRGSESNCEQDSRGM